MGLPSPRQQGYACPAIADPTFGTASRQVKVSHDSGKIWGPQNCGSEIKRLSSPQSRLTALNLSDRHSQYSLGEAPDSKLAPQDGLDYITGVVLSIMHLSESRHEPNDTLKVR